MTDAKVKATSNSVWDTTITITGTYNGPTNVVAAKDYKVIWTIDGKNILESGSTTLELSSGKSVRQVWTSIITPERGIAKFPPAGELIAISVSPFKIDGNKMSYTWEGSVKARSK